MLEYFSEYTREDIEVYNLTASTNSFGQTVEGYGATASSVIVGLIQPLSGGQIARNGGLMENAQYVLYTEYDILLTDRIKQDGKSYGVVWVQPNGIAGTGDHNEVYLEVLNVDT